MSYIYSVAHGGASVDHIAYDGLNTDDAQLIAAYFSARKEMPSSGPSIGWSGRISAKVLRDYDATTTIVGKPFREIEVRGHGGSYPDRVVIFTVRQA